MFLFYFIFSICNISGNDILSACVCMCVCVLNLEFLNSHNGSREFPKFWQLSLSALFSTKVYNFHLILKKLCESLKKKKIKNHFSDELIPNDSHQLIKKAHKRLLNNLLWFQWHFFSHINNTTHKLHFKLSLMLSLHSVKVWLLWLNVEWCCG